jgi:hypothetical protein
MGLLRNVAALGLCALLGSAGCGAKEYINCTDLCNKKKECGTDSNYDITNCTNVCSDRAHMSNDYARKVDTCKECLSGLSCMDYKNMLGCLLNCPDLP